MAMSPDDMVPSGPSSSGQQAVIAYLQSKGLPVNAGNIRRAVEANARDPGSADVNPQTLGPTVLNLRNAGIEDANDGNTSAAPSGNVKIDPLQITSSPPRVPSPATPDAGATDPTSGSSLLQSLVPLLAGGGAAAFPLGRYILDKMRGGGIPGVAGIPGSVPMLPSPETRPLLTGPEARPALSGPEPVPAVAGPRAGAPQIAAPGEAPAIPLPNQSTGRPPIPLQDANVPRPALETAGVQLSPATAPVPPTDASAAVDKAIGGDAPAPRARAPRAKVLRIRPPKL
jgi:hypothetical protein